MGIDDLFELPSDSLPEWATKPIAVFDLETTGLDHRTSRIVTACAVMIDPSGAPLSTHSEWLANPGVPIPPEASAVHGITDEIARAKGRDLAEVVAEIVSTLTGYFDLGIPVVAYNAPYDFTILHQHADDFGIAWPIGELPIIDPLVIDKKLVKYRKGKRRLENVAEIYGVKLLDAHNATADAIAAGQIAYALAKAFPSQLSHSLSELHALQKKWSAELDEEFTSYMHSIGKTDFSAQIGWPEKPR